jgi:DNA-binding winged helix-turn-helix (wHTH) protein/Flp pilus assembly protein TadD
MSKERKEIYEFGPFRLNVGERLFERSDGLKNDSLPEKAFQTLVVLVRNQGSLTTKKELFELVWSDAVVEENNLEKSIHQIRHALGDSPAEQKYVETVRKHGYRFIANIRKVDATISLAARESGSAAKSPDDQLNVSGISLDNEAVSGEGKLSPQGRKRIYVAAAVGLVAALGISGWLVQGNGRSAETPIQSASNAEKLSSKSSVADPGRSVAYDLYIRGKVKVSSENREDTEAAVKLLEEAVAIDPNFAEAYAQLARGYNTMAFKYNSDAETKRFHENAEVAIEKALTLNPNLAEAHFARGLILWTNTKRFPHEQVIQSYKRSLHLAPNLDETHHQLSLVYSHIGLLDEALRSVKKAIEINPNNTLARYRAGVYVAYQGKFDDAIAVYKTVPRDFTPLLVDRTIAEALIQTGRLSEAEAIVDNYLGRYPQDEGGSFTSVKALLLAKAGKQREAEDAIGHAVRIGSGFGHFHHTAYNIASAYAALNRPDDAVKWLEAAADNGFPNYTYFEIDPNLNNIRKHPRFIGFMTKLKPQCERFKALV